MVNIIITEDQIPFILGVSFLVAGSFFLLNSLRDASRSGGFTTFLKIILSLTLVFSSIRLATLGYYFMEIL